MQKLLHLRLLLVNLSENTGLPLTPAEDSIYSAKCFIPQTLMVNESTGRKEIVRDAFVRKMRETMGMQDMLANPVFKERGPGNVRVIIALETLVKMFPGDTEVENIIDKLLETAKGLYLDAKDPVSFADYCHLPRACSLLTLSWGCGAATLSAGVEHFPPSLFYDPGALRYI
jgi:hypothetical protein